MKRALVVVMFGCAAGETRQQPVVTAPVVTSPALVADGSASTVVVTAFAAAVPEPTVPALDEVWLRGSTHVHAKPSGDSVEPIDMRLYLKLGEQALSETWLYQWTPPPKDERRY